MNTRHMARQTSSVPLESFFISDSSPVIRYDGSWTPALARGPDGTDTTVHVAHSRSSLSLSLTATSFTLLTPSALNCAATIKINDSVPVQACSTRGGPFSMSDLPLGVHYIQYDTGAMPSSNTTAPPASNNPGIAFWGIDATRPASDTSRWGNLTFDDTVLRLPREDGRAGEGFIYGGSGGWRFERGERTNRGVANGTLSVTERQGAEVEFQGQGSAVYIYGGMGPEYGSTSVQLDDVQVESALNLTSPWPADRRLLWFRTGLDPATPHKIRLTNLEDKRLSIDLAVLTTDRSRVDALSGQTSTPFTQTLPGKLILYLLIPLVSLILLSLGTWLYIRSRRKRRSDRTSASSSRRVKGKESAQTLRPYWLEDQEDEKDLDYVYNSPFRYRDANGDGDGASANGLTSVHSGIGGHGAGSDARSSRTDMVGELVGSYAAGRKRMSDWLLSPVKSPMRGARASRVSEKSVLRGDNPIGSPSLPNSATMLLPSHGDVSPAVPTTFARSPSPSPTHVTPSGAHLPTTTRPISNASSWAALIRPISGFLGRRSQLLSPISHTSLRSPSGMSGAGTEAGGRTPTSLSGVTNAEYARWTRATPARGTVHSVHVLQGDEAAWSSHGEAADETGTGRRDEVKEGEGGDHRYHFTSSLPLVALSPSASAQALDRTHPFGSAVIRESVPAQDNIQLRAARDRPSNAPSTESNTDALSTAGAPPSFRDNRSIYTARTYTSFASQPESSRGFFLDNPPAMPNVDLSSRYQVDGGTHAATLPARSAIPQGRGETSTNANGRENRYPPSKGRKTGSFPRPALSVGIDSGRPSSPDNLAIFNPASRGSVLDQETFHDTGNPADADAQADAHDRSPPRLPTSPTPGSTPPTSRVPSGRQPSIDDGLGSIVFALDGPIQSALRSAESGGSYSESLLAEYTPNKHSQPPNSASTSNQTPTTTKSNTSRSTQSRVERRSSMPLARYSVAGHLGRPSSAAGAGSAGSAGGAGSADGADGAAGAAERARAEEQYDRFAPSAYVPMHSQDRVHTPRTNDGNRNGNGSGRTSTGSMYSRHSRYSRASSIPLIAARPDSDIIPFEQFIMDLQGASSPAR